MLIQSHHDIPYLANSSSRHKLDIYFPPISPATVPLVVYVHGGAWRTGDKSEFQKTAEGIIRASNYRLVVAVINYQLSNKDDESVRHPSHLLDTMAAVRFLITDQSYPGRSIVDHSRVYLVGHSAGAHLSTLMTLCPHLGFEHMQHIQGVLGIGGIYNIPKLLKYNSDYSDFIDMAFAPSQFADASPHHQAQNLHDQAQHVRFMIINSSQDELVPSEQATDFAGQLVSTGYNDITLIVRDLGGHDESLFNPKFWDIVVQFVFA
ncbi:hypothetical protein IWW36_005100 [Coemansia brasiliensis]|uniref:BD-FAE-like domain-containing protein n=1 Tax=Coemansia brasiliensis TaxID=2650707 RepID=A0A9W8LYF8_9FUNG|nr:hypothetical protein IWW36_005100 [Coemansia brasiliensis]